jgi:hypothetical protein
MNEHRSAETRVARLRTLLVAAIVLRSLSFAIAVVLALLGLLAMGDLVEPISLQMRLVARFMAFGVGSSILVWMLWRARAVWSAAAVALWLEELEPRFEYSLVTALELRDGRGAELERTAARVDVRSQVRRRLLRAMRGSALALGFTVVLLAAMPAGTRTRIGDPRPGDSISSRFNERRPEGRLRPLAVTVIAPRYAGGRSTTVDDPSTVSALVGSTVVVEGRGSPGVTALLSTGGSVAIEAVNERWRARFVAPPRAALLRLRDGTAERLLAIDALVDRIPVVTLTQPTRDTVLRVPAGRIPLVADVRDDLGIATARFEAIVSSGEGESFTFRSTSLGSVANGGRQAALRATLSLDSLALKPGDVVHVRAIAHDANDVSGPGVGTSETRTIRIARRGEYDSVAVEAAPPGIEEKSALSQRMLIMLTEALERRRPQLARPTLTDESRRIASDQARLRRLVGEVIFMRLSPEGGSAEHSHADGSAHDEEAELLERARAAGEQSSEALDFAGGESPVVAINKPLLEAYNAMWEAGRELEQIQPRRALPHMRRALAAIQRARQAERIYLRGRPPVAVIDLAKVRLTGKDKGDPGPRLPLARLDSTTATRARRLAHAVTLADSAPSAAVDSLLVLRVDVVGDAPGLASALDALASAIRTGRDATAPLQRARRAVAGEPTVRDSLGQWSRGLP